MRGHEAEPSGRAAPGEARRNGKAVSAPRRNGQRKGAPPKRGGKMTRKQAASKAVKASAPARRKKR